MIKREGAREGDHIYGKWLLTMFLGAVVASLMNSLSTRRETFSGSTLYTSCCPRARCSTPRTIWWRPTCTPGRRFQEASAGLSVLNKSCQEQYS